MKYIKYTYVDAVTGISIAVEPAKNGPAPPAVTGLQFIWARESLYPTNVPEFFGTCPDESDTQIDGVLGVFAQADWETMRTDEMWARNQKPSTRLTRLEFRNLFTTPEKAMLELVAIDNPAADMPARMQAATLRAYLADVAAAEFIDLADTSTIAGVRTLEDMGLLAAGRSTEILAGIRPHPV